MRLWLDARRPPTSGIGRYGFNLLASLVQLRSRYKFDLTVLASHDTTPLLRAEAPGVRLHTTGIRSPSWEDIFELPRELSGACDVLLSPHFTVSPYVTCRSVVTVHDLWGFKSASAISNPAEILAYHGIPTSNAMSEVVDRFTSTHLDLSPSWVRAIFVRRSSLVDRFSIATLMLAVYSSTTVLTCSAYSRRQIAAGIPCCAGKLRIVYPYARGKNLPRVDSTPDIRRLLVVGKLEPRKNYPFLLRTLDKVFARVAKRLVISVDIVGDIGYRSYGKEVAAAVRNIEPPHRIRFLGLVSEARLWRLYASSDLLIAPSLDEGFGLPILEALEAGLPVLAARRGAFSEVARQYAEYADLRSEEHLAECIVTVLDNHAELSSKAAAGRDHVNRTYTLDRSTRLLEQALLHSILQPVRELDSPNETL